MPVLLKCECYLFFFPLRTTTLYPPASHLAIVGLSICLCDPLPHIVQRYLWGACIHRGQPPTGSVLLFKLLSVSEVRNTTAVLFLLKFVGADFKAELLGQSNICKYFC